jgi:hypothetical protein
VKTFNSDEFEQESKRLKHDLTIKELFGDDVIPTYIYRTYRATPRETALIRKFSMVPLWYLQFLVNASPARIVDIGCGGNLFKPVIKKLYNIPCHGIDPTPENHNADEFDIFDADFSQGHTDFYESAFSINSLHFIPLSYLADRINEFYNVIAPGGMGFLALNAARMIERTQPEWLLHTFGSVDPTAAQVQHYVSEQLSTFEIDFVIVDLLITEQFDELMDGNIRLVFKKNVATAK